MIDRELRGADENKDHNNGLLIHYVKNSFNQTSFQSFKWEKKSITCSMP